MTYYRLNWFDEERSKAWSLTISIASNLFNIIGKQAKEYYILEWNIDNI